MGMFDIEVDSQISSNYNKNWSPILYLNHMQPKSQRPEEPKPLELGNW